jgi:tripartite tricarboxylate transporter TctB family protein
MSRAETVCGVVVSVLGVFAFVPALGMGFLAEGGPGPGFLPTVLSVALIVLGAALVVISRRPQRVAVRAIGGEVGPVEEGARTTVREDDGAERDGRRIPKPVLVWVTFAVSALLLPVFGFAVTMALLLAALIYGVEGKRGWLPMIAVVLVPIVLYELFVDLLAIQMPVGLLDIGLLGI